MKKQIFILSIIWFVSTQLFSQTDTISTNIYQKNGNLGIGVANPISSFELVADQPVFYPDFGILTIKNNHYATFDGLSASDLPHVGTIMHGRRTRGSVLSPENVFAGDRIMGVIGAMYYDNAYHFNSSIEFYAGDNISSDSYESNIVFRTTEKGETERSERMRLSGAGNLGVGTDKPMAKVHVKNGDIYIEDIDKGIIMKSPDGQCWRGTVDNNGNLNFAPIDCLEVVSNISSIKLEECDINIYPNPSDGVFRIEVEEKFIGELYLSVSNSAGKTLFSDSVDQQMVTVDLSKYSSGVYFVKFESESDKIISVKKLVLR